MKQTGGGPPPDEPKFSEDVEMARSFMSKDLAMPSQARKFGLISLVDDKGDPVPHIVIGEN